MGVGFTHSICLKMIKTLRFKALKKSKNIMLKLEKKMWKSSVDIAAVKNKLIKILKQLGQFL